MLDYWSRKIMALLHDPLDKLLRPEHAEDAAKIVKELLEEKNLDMIIEAIRTHHKKDKNEIRISDHNASAINRGLISKDMKNITHIHFQNPFSAHLKNLNISTWKGGMGPQKISEIKSRKYNLNKEGFFNLFRDLTKIYYDLYSSSDDPIAKRVRQNLLLIPEDTRTPSSPIFSHLQMTSALINSFKNGSPEFYLVMVDIGGVQEFISNARKTKDFWASSYIVSLLSFGALKALIEEFGPDQIIVPWTLYIPIIDLVIYKRDLDNEILSKLRSPLIPNTITAIIPKYVNNKKYEANEIRKMIEKALRDIWKIIKDEFRKYLLKDSKLSNVFSDIDDEQFERHLLFESIFSKIRISVLEYEKVSKSNLLKLIDKKRCFDKIRNIPNSELAYPHQKLENFESYMDFLGRVNNSKKFMENYRFKPTPSNESARYKCTMCGIREAIPQNKIDKLRELDIVDLDERLCYLDLLKRSFDKIFEKIIKRLSKKNFKNNLNVEKVPSTTDIGTIWFRASYLAFLLALLDLSNEGQVKEDIFNDIRDMMDGLKKYKSEVKRVLKDIFPGSEKEILLTKYEYESNKLLKKLMKLIELKKELKIPLKEFLKYPSILLFKDEIKTLISRHIEDREKESEYISILEKSFESNVEKRFFNKFKKILTEKKISPEISRRAREILMDAIKKLLGFGDEINVLIIGENLSEILPLAYKPQNRFCLLRADGDNMGKWMTGDENLPWILYIMPEHKELILTKDSFKQPCRDGTILDRSRPISPSILSTLSMVISFQALMIQDIVESFGGFLIYTGGDDVLALIPPEIWYIVYLLIRFTFSREYSTIRSLREFKNGINIYGLGWRATMSFSVVIANHKANLKWIINLSEDLLEEESKELKKDLGANILELKDALTVVLVSRSSVLKKAGPIPNVLFEDSRGIYALKELERKIISNKELITKREGYNKLIEQFISTGRSFIEYLAKNYIFEGITPKSQINQDYKIFTLLEHAYDLMKSVKCGEISMRALYTMLEFYHDFREKGKGKLKSGDLLLLKYDIKRKTGQKASGGTVSNLVNKLLENIKRFSEVRYRVNNEDLSLLEFIPLTIILENVLRNSIV